jgi:[protein-PII] uridylyltransferase
MREFCEQHELSAEDTELVVWLVGQHLTMSSIAQKQDIYDPDVIQRFAELTQTPRRLAALYLLSVADIRGTSPKVWNAWKAKLLEDLYNATLRVLLRGGEVDLNSELEERKTQALSLLRLYAVPAGVEQKLWSQLDMVYFLRHEAKEIAWHARILNRFVNIETPMVRARLSDDHEGIQVLVYTLTSRSCLPAPAPFLAAPTTALPMPRCTPRATAMRWTPSMSSSPSTTTGITAT